MSKKTNLLQKETKIENDIGTTENPIFSSKKNNNRDEIREFFEDLIQNTNLPSIFSKVKVEVNKKENKITLESVNDSKTVILNGEITKPQSWIENTFGLGDMNRLKNLFSHPNFQHREDTIIQINYKEDKEEKTPAEIVFSNSKLRSRATHRFLSKEFLGEAKFRGVQWDIEGNLTQSKINEFFSFSQIESGREENFIIFQDGEDLLLSFGKEGGSTHSLTMCLLSGCKESDNRKPLSWKTSDFTSILRILKEGEGEIKVNLSWRGILLLEKKTKIALYRYILRSTGTA